jgi:hypothetical protein
MMRTRNLIIAVAAVVLAVGGGVWRTHSGGDTSTLLGPLRVVSASAATTLPTPGPITAQQAVAIVTAKLAEFEPTLAWSATGPQQPTVHVATIQNMTSVSSVNSGHVLYTRTQPINAWVVEIGLPASVTGTVNTPLIGYWGFGIVSNSPYTPLNCHGDPCDPPGTLLNAQAFVAP